MIHSCANRYAVALISPYFTQVTDRYATAYPTLQLDTPTFRQQKATQNDVITTLYHDVMTTLYPLLHPVHYHYRHQ